ncbi:MFS transporter [Burkholderia alba]|uniref:MFS transporter n=1 Tax=Burkholderia alba TaxID=2683677 RepID=UPI002B0621F1|nr:MFS transporter [Burkholderia alba]
MSLTNDVAAVEPRGEIGLSVMLTLAMMLPMLILYAIGTLGPYLVRDLRIEPGWLGYVTMGTFALAALLSLGAGPLVDRLGARRALAVLFHSVALAYLLIVALPGFGGIVGAAAICGIAQALCNPVTNLLIAQRVAPSRKAFVVGFKQSGVQLGALFAGLVLPAMAIRFGWRAALGSVIPVAIALGLLALRVAPAAAAATRRREALPRPNALLWWLIGVQGCVGIVLSAFVTFLPMFAIRQGMPAAEAGLMIALFGAMGMLSRVALTPLAARLDDEAVLLLGLLGCAAVALLLVRQADAGQSGMLWAGAAAMGLSAVATNAIAMGMLLRDPAFGGAANASGLLSAAFFGGFSIGPASFGALASASAGFDGAWLMTLVVVAVGAGLCMALIRARRGDPR